MFIGRMIRKLANRSRPVVCLCVLIFMLFGSFFGMFEELCTLIPLVVVLMLSLGMDTMTALGACMLASCFGFSSAITNPFSVGLASSVIGSDPMDGVWLRIVFFVIIFLVLCSFLMLHLRKIERDPARSLTYESDKERRRSIESRDLADIENSDRIFKVYSVFFGIQMVILVLIASVRVISGYAIPVLCVSFLFGGIICGLLVCENKRTVLINFLNGVVSMSPAVIMIALASSVKLIMTESGIIDTIMNEVIGALEGKGRFICILLIYFLILALQIFIGSASAKIMLVVPIVAPICATLGVSPSLFILAYCMADGFTDVIIPTNPVLLVGLSMANVSYAKWVKWTWKLQLIIFALTIGVLAFACAIGY
ncbi:MAG: YfcC family protein [Clostridia bacterium]|nr:YfcC family protein [Clostridia bacterium]